MQRRFSRVVGVLSILTPLLVGGAWWRSYFAYDLVLVPLHIARAAGGWTHGSFVVGCDDGTSFQHISSKAHDFGTGSPGWHVYAQFGWYSRGREHALLIACWPVFLATLGLPVWWVRQRRRRQHADRGFDVMPSAAPVAPADSNAATSTAPDATAHR